MSNAEKMVNIELGIRDDDGNLCDNVNMDISEQDASAIIDKAADLILIFRKYEGKSAQEFYDKAFDKLDDLEHQLMKADVLGDE